MSGEDKGVFTDAWRNTVARALDEVRVERERQHNKFGTQNHHIAVWFLVLGEEYGEANTDALESIIQGDPERMKRCRKELIEVAAVAVAMVESLDRNELAGIKPDLLKSVKKLVPGQWHKLPDGRQVPTREEIENVYAALYPRKIGKTDGVALAMKQIKSPQDWTDFCLAMRKYHQFHTRPLAPQEFRPEPMHFDTFMRNGRWRDVLDENWGKGPHAISSVPSVLNAALPAKPAYVSMVRTDGPRGASESVSVPPEKVELYLSKGWERV